MIKEFLQRHRPLVVLMSIVLVLTTIPLLDIYLVLGDAWQGILPNFTDELNFARMHTIGEGNLTNGNAYYFEHRDGPPLVIFGGAWLNAIPLLLGLSFNFAIAINFIIWTLAFAVTLYLLFRELRVSRWVSVFGTVLIYIESYSHVWRPVNLQPVFPFYFLFYFALIRLIREQSRKNIIFLGCIIGASFYIFAYLWQIALIALGLLFLYALVRKNWLLMKSAFFSSILGCVIGLPVPLYALWLSHTSPYFWESVARLGLVNTHLPMAEVIYTGGWIGVVCAFLAILYYRSRALRESSEFVLLCTFIAISGLGLWVMQGSNVITGKLLETGEHVPRFIFPWLLLCTISLAVFLWERRASLSRGVRVFSIATLLLLSVVNACYVHEFFSPFLISNIDHELWETQQLYAKPFAWLQQAEKDPVVVWSDPHDDLARVLPIFTRHFVLNTFWGMLELVPENEVQERYLVSQYFNKPTVEDLKSHREMLLYLGRHDLPHYAKTLERGIKICRILYFWDKEKDCGTVQTPQELLGEKFFADLETKFTTDVVPNIHEYLKKYHVSYILKDKVLNPTYRPEMLGATRVYFDDRFEIYRL